MNAKLPLYKKKPFEEVRNRTIISTDNDENNNVNTILTTFVQLFKDKHL